MPRTLSFVRRAGVAALALAAGFAVAQSPHKKAAPAPAPAVGPALADAAQVDAAQRVYYGAYDCEFKQTIDVGPSAEHAGYVDVKFGRASYLMKPVLSSSGAIRLEDVKGETAVIQIASKSMLMNVKAGRRLVDGCTCDQQRAQAAAPAPDGALGVAALSE